MEDTVEVTRGVVRDGYAEVKVDWLKTKQDTLVYDYNKETDKLDILWLLETEDGRFYQKTKSINIRKLL